MNTPSSWLPWKAVTGSINSRLRNNSSFHSLPYVGEGQTKNIISYICTSLPYLTRFKDGSHIPNSNIIAKFPLSQKQTTLVGKGVEVDDVVQQMQEIPHNVLLYQWNSRKRMFVLKEHVHAVDSYNRRPLHWFKDNSVLLVGREACMKLSSVGFLIVQQIMQCIIRLFMFLYWNRNGPVRSGHSTQRKRKHTQLIWFWLRNQICSLTLDDEWVDFSIGYMHGKVKGKEITMFSKLVYVWECAR